MWVEKRVTPLGPGRSQTENPTPVRVEGQETRGPHRYVRDDPLKPLSPTSRNLRSLEDSGPSPVVPGSTHPGVYPLTSGSPVLFLDDLPPSPHTRVFIEVDGVGRDGSSGSV